MRRFVSRPIAPSGDGFLTAADGNAPPVPQAFAWEGGMLRVAAIVRTWRTTKTDRGDAYLKRHWFELRTQDGAILEVYYDRQARRGASQWWLYTIASAAEPD